MPFFWSTTSYTFSRNTGKYIFLNPLSTQFFSGLLQIESFYFQSDKAFSIIELSTEGEGFDEKNY